METADQSLVMDIFLPKKRWVPDSEAKTCFSCDNSFNIMNRKHHCRMCGNIFDRKCANFFLSPPFFVFGKEKKIRVCSSCHEKSNFITQEKKALRIDKQKSLQYLDPSKRIDIDSFLSVFLTEKFYEQADRVLAYCLKEKELFDDWYEVLKPLVKDSIEMVKPKAVENSRYNINDFVKVKKLHSENPEAQLIKGIVLRKNIANKKMGSNIDCPTILMIKGSLEPYNINEVSVLDGASSESEAIYLKALSEKINKLDPIIIVVERTVNRAVQELILKSNKVLVMKLRNEQFRKIVRYTGAKPVQDITGPGNLNVSVLGYCNKFFVEKLDTSNLADMLASKENKNLIEPSLMFFDGCDTTRGVTITLRGPDLQQLKNVKKCLKEVLVLVKNLYFERGVIYQDISLYHMKERLWRIISDCENINHINTENYDIRDSLTLVNPLNEGDVTPGRAISCLVNKNTYFSAGFMSHYLTEKKSIQLAVKNNSIKFSRIVLIPININFFPDLIDNKINIQEQLFPRLRNTNRLHKDDVCQLEKDPQTMDVMFYGKEDASLGLYLLSKASRVFETCLDCNRSYYYHTTIFFIKNFYIKVSSELKNQAKLKQIVSVSKKIKESPKHRKMTLAPQAKEGFIDFLGKVAPSHRHAANESINRQSKLGLNSSCYESDRSLAPIDVIMFLECSQCKNRLSELVKLKQEFLDYSFSRYLENMTLAAEQYQEFVEPGQMSSLDQDIPRKSSLQPCCSSSFKNRVFIVEDLFIRFKLGFSNSLSLSQLTFTSPDAMLFLQNKKEQLMKSKQQQLVQSVKEYTEMLVFNLQEVLITLAEKSNIHLNSDNLQLIEGLLSTPTDEVQVKNAQTLLLIGIFSVYKEMEDTKEEIEADLNRQYLNHLEVDFQRKIFFNRFIKFSTSLEKVKREYSKAMHDQKSLNQPENAQNKLMPSIAESNRSYAEDFLVDPESARYQPRKSTFDDAMLRSYYKKAQNKSTLNDAQMMDSDKDKEIALMEKLAKGITIEGTPDQNNKKFEFIPISEDELLSILAHTMNSSSYIEEVYMKEGFADMDSVASEERKTDETLEDLLAKKVQQTDDNTIKQFQLKIPPLEIKIKYFNRLIRSFVDNKKDNEPVVRDKKPALPDPMQDLTLFGERFDFVRRRSRYSNQKIVVQKTGVTVHYPVHFEMLRLYNGINLESYLDSLSTSQDWNNSGGKTGAKFIKTFDERFVFKQLEKKEFSMLLGFVGDYFKYMFRVCQEKQPTLLSKIYGIYEIQDEKQNNIYFIAMENIFFGMDQKIKVYDLKGSELRRYSGKHSEEGQTILDTDYKIERNGEPLPLKSENYSFIEKAIKFDTELLSNLRVVDYSLLLILDESKSLVRMGIIDYLRIYDLEKQLEHVSKKFIKGFTPTIVSPDLYKERFQKAMKKYFMPIYSDSC